MLRSTAFSLGLGVFPALLLGACNDDNALSQQAVEPVAKPLSLAEMKTHPELQDMWLIRQSRLSVCPVTPAEWNFICKLCGVKP